MLTLVLLAVCAQVAPSEAAENDKSPPAAKPAAPAPPTPGPAAPASQRSATAPAPAAQPPPKEPEGGLEFALGIFGGVRSFTVLAPTFELEGQVTILHLGFFRLEGFLWGSRTGWTDSQTNTNVEWNGALGLRLDLALGPVRLQFDGGAGAGLYQFIIALPGAQQPPPFPLANAAVGVGLRIPTPVQRLSMVVRGRALGIYLDAGSWTASGLFPRLAATAGLAYQF